MVCLRPARATRLSRWPAQKTHATRKCETTAALTLAPESVQHATSRAGARFHAASASATIAAISGAVSLFFTATRSSEKSHRRPNCTIMESSETPSILELPHKVILLSSFPADILDFHIFMHLSTPCLLACLMSCTRFRKILLPLLSFPSHIFSMHQHSILKDIYRRGYLPLLLWFQNELKYPKFSTPSLFSLSCLELAAGGTSRRLYFYNCHTTNYQ